MKRSILFVPFGIALLLAPMTSGAAAPADRAATLDLSVTGRASHAPDAMRARLEAVGRAKSAAEAQSAVNRIMTMALNEVDHIKGLVAVTGGYSVVPANPERTAWLARQGLTLTYDAAPDAAAAAPVRAMLGRLQQAGMQLQALDGTLTAKTASATRETAIADAARRLRAEAASVAKALGKTLGPLRSVRLGGQAIYPALQNRAFMAKAVAPVARPGPVEERVSLSATIELRPASP